MREIGPAEFTAFVIYVWSVHVEHVCSLHTLALSEKCLRRHIYRKYSPIIITSWMSYSRTDGIFELGTTWTHSRSRLWRSIKSIVVLIISEFPTHGSDAGTVSLETGTDLIRPLRGYVHSPWMDYTYQLMREFLLKLSAPPFSSRLMDERKGNLNFTYLICPYIFKLNYIKRNHNKDAELSSAYLHVCLLSQRYETVSIRFVIECTN
jgi:hypothetical protein